MKRKRLQVAGALSLEMLALGIQVIEATKHGSKEEHCHEQPAQHDAMLDQQEMF